MPPRPCQPFRGRPGKTSGWHRKDARGMSVSLALVMALSVSRFGQGLAREAGTEKSGVLGVNLSRASNHHARVFVGAQDEQSGTISAFPVGSARYAVNARIARALCPHNTPQPRIDRPVDKRRASHPLPLPRSAGKGASGAARLGFTPDGHLLMADKAANSIRLFVPLRQPRLAEALDDARVLGVEGRVVGPVNARPGSAR